VVVCAGDSIVMCSVCILSIHHTHTHTHTHTLALIGHGPLIQTEAPVKDLPQVGTALRQAHLGRPDHADHGVVCALCACERFVGGEG
jgi:hypothetical protein